MTTQPDSPSITPAAIAASPTSSAASAPSRRMRHSRILTVVLIVIVAIALLIAGAYWMIYRSPQENAVKTTLKQSLPFPVARVDEEWILLRVFEENVNTQAAFIQRQAQEQPEAGEPPSLQEIRTAELGYMTNQVLMKHLAAARGVAVTSTEVDAYFTETILPQASSEEEVRAVLLENYGWTLADFKEKVVTDAVLKTKLYKAVQEDPALETATRTKAEEVYAEVLKTDRQFSELAQEYSDDPGSAAQGGMLGFFGTGEMVPEFEAAAFALQIGEVSQPVKTQYGYHIIKVTDRDDAAGTVEARHILIAFTTFDELLEEYKKAAQISTWMPVYQ